MLNAFKSTAAVRPSGRGRPAGPPEPVSGLVLSLPAWSLAAPLIGTMLTNGHVGPLFIVDWTPTVAWIDWSVTAAIVLALLTIAEGTRDRTSPTWARAARTAARVIRVMTIAYVSLIWIVFLVLLIGFGPLALLTLPAPVLALLNLVALPVSRRILIRTEWAAR